MEGTVAAAADVVVAVVGADDPLNVAVVAVKLVVATTLVVKLVVATIVIVKLLVAAVITPKLVAVSDIATKLVVVAVIVAELVVAEGGTDGRGLCLGTEEVGDTV